jgi:hypothetical protein
MNKQGMASMPKAERVRIARLGGLAVSKNREQMRAIGKLGGKACLKKMGKKYFSELGKLGGRPRKK